MSRPDGRIEPGQPLRGAISARAWNRTQDAADLVLGSFLTVSSGPSSPHASSYTQALLQNNTGQDYETFRGIPCSGFVGSDSTTGNAGNASVLPKMSTIVLNGAATSGTLEVDQPWCVTLEPIKAGSVGKVAVSGVVPFLVSSGLSAGGYVSRIGEVQDIGQAQLLFDTNGYFGLIHLGKANYTFSITTDQAWARNTQKSIAYGITAVNFLYDVKAGEKVVVSKLFNSYQGKMQWSLISARPSAIS
jgi:hypothetical protein